MNANIAMLVLQVLGWLRNETGFYVLRVLFLLLLFFSLVSVVLAQERDSPQGGGVAGVDAVAAADGATPAALPGAREVSAPSPTARRSTVILWDETGSGSKGTARVGADDAAEAGVSGTDKAH